MRILGYLLAGIILGLLTLLIFGPRFHAWLDKRGLVMAKCSSTNCRREIIWIEHDGTVIAQVRGGLDAKYCTAA